MNGGMLRRMVVREKTLKYWLMGGPVMALGSNQYWGMHRYTRRVRLWLYLSLLAIGILLTASLVMGYTPKRLLPPTRPGASVIIATVVSIASAYLAVRLMTLPVLVYGAWVAARVRRSSGGVCWDCGRIVESEQAEGCGCGSRWSREELRRFWIATELLPASKEELRAQRHLLRGESVSDASSPRHWALRFLTPLPRDEMICWQQRPITKRWVQRAMYLGAGLSTVLFAILVFATIPLVRTLQSGSLSPFVSGMLFLDPEQSSRSSLCCVVRFGTA